MRRLRNDDGATAVLITILMTVLLGFSALVIDVGGMHSEVAQLQNVADAAAMAIAQDCAGGNCGNAAATSQVYAAGNSRDDLSDTSVAIPGENGANTVTVTASTREAVGGNDGSTSTLAWALAQATGQSELTFQRKATASWGAFGGGATIPIALCKRNWDHFTQNGAVLPSGPPAHIVKFGSPNSNAPIVAYQDCSNPSADTYAGAFGFLQRDVNCMAVTAEGGNFAGSTGSNAVDPSSPCTVSMLYSTLKVLINSPKPVLVPIFDAFTGSGNSGTFHIVGYGAFVLQGYSFGSGPDPVNRTYGMTASECPGNGDCLKGYYTEFVSVEAAATYSAGPGYGGYTVGLTG